MTFSSESKFEATSGLCRAGTRVTPDIVTYRSPHSAQETVDRLTEATTRLGIDGMWLLVTSAANCAGSGIDPDQWFPVSTGIAAARREASEALAICATCAVRRQCLELALRSWTIGQHGIWGGTVAGEREALRGRLRRKNPAAAGDAASWVSPNDPAGLVGRPGRAVS